jgi:hypothetical protein
MNSHPDPNFTLDTAEADLSSNNGGAQVMTWNQIVLPTVPQGGLCGHLGASSRTQGHQAPTWGQPEDPKVARHMFCLLRYARVVIDVTQPSHLRNELSSTVSEPATAAPLPFTLQDQATHNSCCVISASADSLTNLWRGHQLGGMTGGCSGSGSSGFSVWTTPPPR